MIKKLIFIAVAPLLLFASNVFAASQLSVGTHTLTMGTTSQFEVPVDIYTNEEKVSAIQFDVDYDDSCLLFDSVSAGNALTSVNKQVAYNEVSSGTVRIIGYGLNQNEIQDGVVAKLAFNLKSMPPLGLSPISIKNMILSDPDGNSVSVSGTDGYVKIELIDLQKAINIVLNIETNPAAKIQADINIDGNVDVLDIQLIVNIKLVNP